MIQFVCNNRSDNTFTNLNFMRCVEMWQELLRPKSVAVVHHIHKILSLSASYPKNLLHKTTGFGDPYQPTPTYRTNIITNHFNFLFLFKKKNIS